MSEPKTEYTIEEFRELVERDKDNKFNAKKKVVDGIKFASTREAQRYFELKLLEKSGDIYRLELQPEFILLEKFTHNGKKVNGIKYKADFRYYEDGKCIVEDVKGFETPVFKIKWKFFLKFYGMSVDARIVK